MATHIQTSEPADFSAQPGTPPPSGSTLAETLLVVRKRKWVLIGALVLGVALGIYRATTQPVIYTATGKIEVTSGSSNQYRYNAATGPTLDPTTHLATEVAILQSDSLALQIAREMDLANNEAFLGYKPKTRQSLDDARTRQNIIRQLHSGLKIASIKGTELISISYISSRPQLAADVVNHIINGYMQRSFETRFASTQRISQWLSGQLDDLKRQVETSQEQLIDLQKQLGVLGLGFDVSKSETTTTNALDALSKAATEARINRILAESKYRVLSGTDPSELDNVAATGGMVTELSRLRGEIADAKADLAKQTQVYGPNHIATKAAQNRIAELQRAVNTEQSRLVAQAHQALITAQANEKQTADALEAAKNEAYKLRDDLVEYTLRQREYESNRTLYEGLLSRLRAAGVQAGLESMEIDIVDPALPPADRTMEPRTGIILTTTLFTMIAGFVVAFLLESLDTGLRSVAEVESFTGLPSLAVVPRVRRSVGDAAAGQSIAASNISVLGTSKSQFAESLRALRTALLLANTGHPPKIIMVASSTPAEGKTTIATNLAVILAQRETRVLIIDSDLRRPNVHHRFGLSGKVGLSNVLAGSMSFDEALQRIPEVPNLDILCSGPVPPFPTEMLSSERMHDLLQQAIERYTHIVLDSPPVLSVTDGVVLARQADAVALVVRHGKSSRHIVRRSRDLLLRAGAPITGIVLNAVDTNSPEYYGYYGYSGYAYANMDTETWDIEELKRQQKNGQKGEE